MTIEQAEMYGKVCDVIINNKCTTWGEVWALFPDNPEYLDIANKHPYVIRQLFEENRQKLQGERGEIELKIKKLSPKAIIPSRGTSYSAGLDLYVVLPEPTAVMTTTNGHDCNVWRNEEIDKCCVCIPPHSTLLIPTGLAVAPSESKVGMFIFPRSGLATKYNIDLANSVAVVDSDYRGEIQIPLRNNSDDHYILKDGDRIAQMVVMPVLYPSITTVTELDETERGAGGFGSTGK